MRESPNRISNGHACQQIGMELIISVVRFKDDREGLAAVAQHPKIPFRLLNPRAMVKRVDQYPANRADGKSGRKCRDSRIEKIGYSGSIQWCNWKRAP